MSSKTERTGGLSRRDFLAGGVLAAAGAAAATVLGPATATAAEGRLGDWSSVGGEVSVPASEATNASASDGTYREHNAEAFPADDATPIPPRKVPANWDYECEDRKSVV